MNPFVGQPFNGSDINTWGKTNYYDLNKSIISNPLQTRIGGKNKKNKSKKLKKNKKSKKNKLKKYKKGGGFLDQRYVFPGVTTSRNLINSVDNLYNTFKGNYQNISPSPLNQPIYSGST